MLNTPLIYRRLSPALQQRLTQLALLQQRAAVLAKLPAITLTKGKPVRWAATPAPLLLRQVMLLAAEDDSPKLSALLLRNWFQHKQELRTQVRQMLYDQHYPVAPLGLLPEPAETVLRLLPEDCSPTGSFFAPDGQLPAIAGASPEEVTLMAELSGWCVRRPGPDELDLSHRWVECLQLAYNATNSFEEILRQIQEEAPASAAAALARQGTLPDTLDDPAATQALNWEEVHSSLLTFLDSIFKLTKIPAPAAGEPITRATLEELLSQLEDSARYALVMAQFRGSLLDSLAQVERVRHRQQPGFAPLAEVHQQARELASQTTSSLNGKQMSELWKQAQPLLGLLDWINGPERFEQPTPDSQYAEAAQEVEAALPAGVFNALLLRKLVIAEVEQMPADGAAPTQPE